MSKRQEIRARRRRQQMWNRILVILFVSAGALLVVFALIIPSLQRSASGSADQGIVIPTPRDVTVAMEGVHMGDPNAPVKMDVWEDFQCSGCMSYSLSTEPQVISAYVETGKVYYTFHFYPFIDGGQGESQQAANAALCADEQGRFWDYHDILFSNWLGENVGSFTDERLTQFAEAIGLDMTAFSPCFQANTYIDHVVQDMQLGDEMGVPPTPGLFVNGQLVVSSSGPSYVPSFADIASTIEAALQANQ